MANKGKPPMLNGGISYARELKQMPDHSNELTRQTEARLGGFVYDNEHPYPNNALLISRGPFEMDNGAIYHGQWTKDGLREGKGT